MYRNRTIVLKKESSPKFEEDDLSTLSGGSVDNVKRPLVQQIQTKTRTKDKLHSYLSSRGNNDVTTNQRRKNGAESRIANVPFDEELMMAEMAVDETNSDSDGDSVNTPVFETWQVQEDGNLELHVAPRRPRNKFERSEKSAFLSTFSQTTRSENKIDVSKNGNAETNSKSNEKKQTRLERLRKRHGRLHSKKALTSQNKSHQCEDTPDKKDQGEKAETNFELEKGKVQQNISRLQLKLQEAMSINQSHRLLLDEITNPDSDGMKSLGSNNTHRDKKIDENKIVQLAPPSPSNSNSGAQIIHTYQSLSKKIHPKSPGSSFSVDTRTTECTSSTSPLTNKNGYTPLNTTVLKERFHKNFGTPKSKEKETQIFSSPEIFGNYVERLDFDELTSPPKMRRRADISLLTETSESCCSTTLQREEKKSQVTSLSPLSNREDASNEISHKINLSIELSGSSMLALQNIVNKIKKDLGQYELNYDTLSITTKCSSIANEVQHTKNERNDNATNENTNQLKTYKEAARKQETKPSQILSMSTVSFLQNFRQAVSDTASKHN